MKAFFIFGFLSFYCAGTASALNAPNPFQIGESSYTPVDIHRIEIKYSIDPASKTSTAHAHVEFTALNDGFPIIDLVQEPTNVWVNEVIMNVEDYAVVNTPNRETKVRAVRSPFKKGENGSLSVEFSLGRQVSYEDGNAALFFDFSDLDDRSFLEKYAPSNLEFDQAKVSVELEIVGASNPYRVFANGEITSSRDNRFFIEYPQTYTSSSMYLHVAPQSAFMLVSDSYDGISAKIPMIIYGTVQSDIDRGLQQGKSAIKEFEALYGAYPHKSYIAYIVSDPLFGGMEFSGATITSLRAQRHETNHFWFARSVMPTNGAAGWIDEAIASWSDRGFIRSTMEPVTLGSNLAKFPEYTRKTSTLAYSKGEIFMRDLDYLLAGNGGLQMALKKYFETFTFKPVSNASFQSTVESVAGRSLESYFKKYVYGESLLSQKSHKDHLWQERGDQLYRLNPDFNPHHRRYTRAELHSAALGLSSKGNNEIK